MMILLSSRFRSTPVRRVIPRSPALPVNADAVLAAYKRGTLLSFAITWAELARFDLSARDVSSVRVWSNSGDTAHEAHIRRLVAERRIPFIKWGHLLRFDPAEIERWLDDARRRPE